MKRFKIENLLQNLREKLGVEKQPVSAHPFEPVNHLPEEQLADKTPAELLTIVKERVETIHTNLVETTQENLLTTIQQIVAEFGGAIFYCQQMHVLKPMD